MRDRVKELTQKDFQNKNNFKVITDYGQIKIRNQVVDDAIWNITGDLKKTNSRLADKATVLKAIDDCDLKTMREISDFFYRTSGIYSRILRYMAFMYRYDWYITPYINNESMATEKILTEFHKALNTLDNFNVKKNLGEIALKVLRHGCYYGYKVQQGDTIVLQELDSNYCRSRMFQGNKPVVEFNMKYFDDKFRDPTQRIRILKMFPKEFVKGYKLFKENKLTPEFTGDTNGWYVLSPDDTVKFTINGEDYPAFISVIPLILDLDNAQALDRKRVMQRLLKIVIQKLPLDKNGEMIFDMDEAAVMHQNAVRMLADAMGTEVLTTFADTTVEDMEGSGASAQVDDLEKVERQLFNEAGISQMQFNTDGNIALEKSVKNDEATMYNFLLQCEMFLNELVPSKNKKLNFRVQLLTTTIYNYQEMAKLYKEQTQLGYSKMLPQIALGQSQSSILANAFFENNILDLVNVFIPPLMSSTMNSDVLKNRNGIKTEENSAGREELPDDQKSTKTLQNKESMS